MGNKIDTLKPAEATQPISLSPKFPPEPLLRWKEVWIDGGYDGRLTDCVFIADIGKRVFYRIRAVRNTTGRRTHAAAKNPISSQISIIRGNAKGDDDPGLNLLLGDLGATILLTVDLIFCR